MQQGFLIDEESHLKL